MQAVRQIGGDCLMCCDRILRREVLAEHQSIRKQIHDVEAKLRIALGEMDRTCSNDYEYTSPSYVICQEQYELFEQIKEVLSEVDGMVQGSPTHLSGSATLKVETQCPSLLSGLVSQAPVDMPTVEQKIGTIGDNLGQLFLLTDLAKQEGHLLRELSAYSIPILPEELSITISGARSQVAPDETAPEDLGQAERKSGRPTQEEAQADVELQSARREQATSNASGDREPIFGPADLAELPEQPERGACAQKHPETFHCHLCPKYFTRASKLRLHFQTHTDDRHFVCAVCGEDFSSQDHRDLHEDIHLNEEKIFCKGGLLSGLQWGCGRGFAGAKALARHFSSEEGRVCIRSRLDEEQAESAVEVVAPGPHVDSEGEKSHLAALLAQYPMLGDTNWRATLQKSPPDEGGLSGHGARLLSDQIRLLDVLPADSHDNRVRCMLRTVPLKHARFTAISYVWGKNADVRSIELNNTTMEVTANAFAVLRTLSAGSLSGVGADSEVVRQISENRIWLDAICINQTDEKEKEAQVRIMQDIYSQAESTLIWLGSPGAADRGAGVAINFLRRIVGYLPFEAFKAAGQKERMHLWDEDAWASAHELMSQPWFHRRWVIQETALSRNPWVLYGRELISWADFSDGVERLAYLFSDQTNKPRFQNSPPRLVFDIEPTLAINRLRRADIKNSGQPLVYLLSQLRRCDSSVPQDRIFALLGLCGENERQANTPTYKMSVRDVCVRMACAHIRIFNNLNILCIATEAARVLRRETSYWRDHVKINPEQVGMPRGIHLSNLPTWVPNVTSMFTNWVFGQETTSYREIPSPLFDASCGHSAQVYNIDECQESGVLVAGGIEVDVIDAVEPHTPVPNPDHQYSNSRVFANMYDFAHRYWKPGGVYISELDFLTAYFRTITAGGRRESTRDFLTDEYLRHYCLTFFSTAEFGDRLIARYGIEPEPKAHCDRYIDPEAGTRYNDNAKLSFDRLCFSAFACTKKGRMALVPPHTRPGDRICVLYGCSSPLLLEPSETHPGYYCTRGEVFMDGIMFGGAIEQMMNRLSEDQVFHLL